VVVVVAVMMSHQQKEAGDKPIKNKRRWGLNFIMKGRVAYIEGL
jgi:hypothetical protein